MSVVEEADARNVWVSAFVFWAKVTAVSAVRSMANLVVQDAYLFIVRRVEKGTKFQKQFSRISRASAPENKQSLTIWLFSPVILPIR